VFYVKHVARLQDEVRFLPRLVEPGVVVDGYFPFSHHLETISGDDDSGALRQTDAQ
jgi:hypothetical protein